MSATKRMASDYRRVVLDEHGEDWSIEIVAAGPKADISCRVLCESGGYDAEPAAMTTEQMRAFGETLVGAANGVDLLMRQRDEGDK